MSAPFGGTKWKSFFTRVSWVLGSWMIDLYGIEILIFGPRSRVDISWEPPGLQRFMRPEKDAGVMRQSGCNRLQTTPICHPFPIMVILESWHHLFQEDDFDEIHWDSSGRCSRWGNPYSVLFHWCLTRAILFSSAWLHFQIFMHKEESAFCPDARHQDLFRRLSGSKRCETTLPSGSPPRSEVIFELCIKMKPDLPQSNDEAVRGGNISTFSPDKIFQLNHHRRGLRQSDK